MTLQFSNVRGEGLYTDYVSDVGYYIIAPPVHALETTDSPVGLRAVLTEVRSDWQRTPAKADEAALYPSPAEAVRVERGS